MKQSREKISQEEILKKAALLSADELDSELESYMKKADALTDEITADEEFLRFVAEYDKKRCREKKKISRRFVQIAAVFVVAAVTLGGMTLEASEAFKSKNYELSVNKDTGEVILVPDNEKEVLNDSAKADKINYPQYLPEGLIEVSCSEDNVARVLSFMPQDESYEIVLYEYEPENLSMTYNMEINTLEEIDIGEYKGYLFTNVTAKNLSLIWQMDNKVLKLSAFDFDNRKEFIKIAESIK